MVCLNIVSLLYLVSSDLKGIGMYSSLYEPCYPYNFDPQLLPPPLGFITHLS